MRYFRRFSAAQRILHSFMMLSFLGLAMSGMPLLFSEQPWARVVARLFGGFEAAGIFHRACAVVMIIVFGGHVLHMAYLATVKREWKRLLWGPDSMVPQPQDAYDMGNHFKWFLHKGPRPTFDRWTYWEKFDYWAVFWGMFIIGGSGLMLWFPVFFAHFVPGWMFNVASLVHGEEALLAVGFIFTIHFFNGHFRPEKFPMDTVIFTGRISEEELKHERAPQYERLAREGRLAAYEAPAPTLESKAFGWVVGGSTLVLGLITAVLIVYSVIR